MILIAGIGSRETPPEICWEMTEIGRWVAYNKHWMRSGHAEGADYAFETGAQRNCIVYLPSPNFNSKLPILGRAKTIIPTRSFSALINEHHPNPNALSDFAWKLMARNCAQILGESLDKPSDCVICWTPRGELVGGTSFAIRLATARGILVFNMAFEEYSTTKKIIKVIHEKILKTPHSHHGNNHAKT